MSGNKFPLSAKYPDRVLCIAFITLDGANLPTINDSDGFDTTIFTHTGGTGVYGFALADKYAKVGGFSVLHINSGATQYFTKTAFNATTRAVTVTTLTEAGVATQVAAGELMIFAYAADNNLPPA